MKYANLQNLPVLGICGYSGSGKTTLIEALIPYLVSKGLRVMTLKHDVHGLDVDKRGKDSDRFFRAGSDVFLNGLGENLARFHESAADSSLTSVLEQMIPHYDLILVEGHKFTPLPHKIWLRRHSSDKCPKEIPRILCDLNRTIDRQSTVRKLVDSWLPEIWNRTPVYGGILIGGKSRRMGRPKHLIAQKNHTWLENTIEKVRPFVEDIVILGRGKVPAKLNDVRVLPDIEEECGPKAGMLSAMRWNPGVSWIFAACDLPMISGAAVKWLKSQRTPGTWAVVPSLPGKGTVEPLLAWYDFRARTLLEECPRPMDMAGRPKVVTAEPPTRIAAAWTNVNTPAEMKALR